MKSFLILLLVAGLALALFFTRPTQEDFAAYVKAHPEIIQGQAAKGDSIADKLAHQMKSFSIGGVTIGDPVEEFLKSCKFDNRFYCYENVSRDGEVVYTGVLGHWFARNGATPAAKPA